MTAFKISCEQVGCRYTIRQGHRRPIYHDALTKVTFSLSSGERLGVLGVNGAGKSTLLKIMAGLLFPTSGRVRYEGTPNCALLGLRSSWFPELSGRENAVLSCLLSGLRRREAEAKLQEIAQFADLGEWFEQPMRTYSSGMSTRLGLAVALQVRPDVLLLDEALNAGDALFQKKAAAAIKGQMESAQSVVLVSHSTKSIRSFCTRAIWLEDGQLKAEGSVEELLGEYDDWVRTSAAREIRAPQARVPSGEV